MSRVRLPPSALYQKEVRIIKKFYVTTAIDYVNGRPHQGHSYEKTCADVLARWHRQKGEDVFFLTGTDENAQKNAQAASAAGIPIKKFVDTNVKFFLELCKKYNISQDRFIRTTEDEHKKISQQLFEKAYQKGEIYKGTYEGYYCSGCEAFVTEKDLVNGKCPEHERAPEYIKEENYFFKLSKYTKQIIKLLSSKDFVCPEKYRNEILTRVKTEGLKDLCVSRKKQDWGIDVPFNRDFKIYTWYDALINYLSGLDYPRFKYKKYWPCDAHVIGKGINFFHSVIWPAMLINANISVPKTILVHGYINLGGKKMSKSCGATVDPIELVDKYGPDAIRYFFIREVPFGEDLDFSEKSLVERYNGELANDLGNLVSRTLSLLEKLSNGKIPKGKLDPKLNNISKKVIKQSDECITRFELHKAIESIWSLIKETNKYIQDNKPWENKDNVSDVLFNAANCIRTISALVYPFIPSSAEEIAKQLGIKVPKFKDLNNSITPNVKVKKGNIIFPKLEYKDLEAEFSDKKVIVDNYIKNKIENKEVSVAFGEFVGLNVQTRSGELERMKKELKLDEKKLNQVIDSYRYLVDEGRDKHDAPLSSENLLQLFKKKQLPNINTLTDAYNLISLKTGIIMGVYDEKSITGDVKLKVADGSEYFVSIGDKEPTKIQKGEYLVCDSDNKVLTKWVTKQGDYVAVNKSTRRAIICVQGNKNISQKEIDKTLNEVAKSITEFCGGKFRKIII